MVHRRPLLGLALVAVLLAGLSPSRTADAQIDNPPSGPVRVLIGFNRPPGAAEEALVRGVGGHVRYTYRLVPAIAATVPGPAIATLQQARGVLRVEPDRTVRKLDHAAELDNTWGVKRIGAGTVHHDSNQLGASTAGPVTVAVIDTGVDYNHPELAALFDPARRGWDFVNGDADPMDDEGHGTHVAGTVAAAKDGVGVVGVAPAVRLYALKVLDHKGSGYWSDIIAALQWAVDHDVQVTNNSYGAGQNPGTTVQQAFAAAEASGLLSIAAAGNSGNCGGKGNSIGYPARYASVVAVTATNSSDGRPCFSSTGAEAELAAPGVSITSTRLGGGYVVYNGTSMASPHVAGVAALVIGAGIGDTNGNGRVNDEVRSLLAETAQDLGAAGHDPQYGFGLVNAAAAVGAVAPAILEPAVTVVVSTDKAGYVENDEITLTAVVADERGTAITGLETQHFSTTVGGAEAALLSGFAQTETPGIYTATLAATTGNHVVTVAVTDARGLTGSGSASYAVTSSTAPATAMTVSAIEYWTTGGKNNDRHLSLRVTVRTSPQEEAVSGASVTIRLDREGSLVGSATGTTGSTGSATFSLNNAGAGCYSTTVTDVVAAGLTWDGATPANQFCK
jgi:subtilisin